MYADPSGHFVLSSFLIAVGIGAVAGFLGSYIPDVYEKIKKDGFQFSDLNTFAENGKEYLFNTFIRALTGAAGGMGLSLFISAPLVGAINTYAAYMTGQISTFGEALGYFAFSTTLSFITLGIQKAASAYKTPVKVRGLNNTVNKLVYGFEKTLYWIGESADFSVGLTVSISTGLRGL